jgi:hypothetical protein
MKLKIFNVLCGLLLFICNISFAQDGEVVQVDLGNLLKSDNIYVQNAAKLKQEVDEANLHDLNHLWVRTGEIQFSGNQTFRPYEEEIQSRLLKDKEKLKKFKSYLDTQSGEARGVAALRTSLTKLIGIDEGTGILDDASKLLADSVLDALRNESGNFELLQGNEITVHKTLLIYSMFIAMTYVFGSDLHLQAGIANLKDLAGFELDILYPAVLPTDLPVEIFEAVSEVGLVYTDLGSGKSYLMVPNAGFVYGGNFLETDVFDGEGTSTFSCAGVDCSALVSRCVNFDYRMTTMVMEYACKGYSSNLTEQDFAILSEFRASYHLDDIETSFWIKESPRLEDLQPGDLILWRWDNSDGKGRSGHTAMYINSDSEHPGYVIAFEATRLDDKSIEGILFRRFKLKKEDKQNLKVYAFRRS